MKIKFIKGHGLTIELDPAEINRDDVGQGTPVMVHLDKFQVSSTYWCIMDTGEIEDNKLSDEQMKWLASKESEIDRFLQKN